jgi:hypothetical protein
VLLLGERIELASLLAALLLSLALRRDPLFKRTELRAVDLTILINAQLLKIPTERRTLSLLLADLAIFVDVQICKGCLSRLKLIESNDQCVPFRLQL